MTKFDLAISYTWIYDIEFVQLIEKIFQKNDLSTYLIHEENIEEVINLLKNRRLVFTAYLDRASDEDPAFEPITQILAKRKCYIINPHFKVKKVIKKSYMHKKLEMKNFSLPKTIILPPYDKDNSLKITEDEILKLSNPFIIKPGVYSGGGEGVVKNATSITQIQTERMKSHSEEYLLQEKIFPKSLEGRRAWFRVFWAFNKVIPAWWNDLTHIYFPVTKEQTKKHHLQPLSRITKKIARLTGMDYFSTEIALTKKNRFILIDYVNDQCDMRLKSIHPDGVPDSIVVQFIEQMKQKVLALKK